MESLAHNRSQAKHLTHNRWCEHVGKSDKQYALDERFLKKFR